MSNPHGSSLLIKRGIQGEGGWLADGTRLTLDRALEDSIPYLFSLLGIVEGEDPLAQMDGRIKKRRTLEAIKRIALRETNRVCGARI
jgi:hypothetical protein